MENIDSILEGIKKYERTEGDLKDDFPPILEEYLRSVSKSGDPLLPWNVIRKFIKNKLEVVITEFFNFYGGEDLVEAKNLPSFSYLLTKNRILKHFDTFVGAPFTIQRLCEILVDPMRHYKRTDKFLRGLEKNILVVTHVEPGRNKRKCESPHPFLANGMQSDQSIPHLSPTNKSSVSYPVTTNSDNFEEERNSVGNLTASYLVGILNKDYESNGPVNKRPRLEMGENDMSHHNGEASSSSSSSINVPLNENDDSVSNHLETQLLSPSRDSGSRDSGSCSFRPNERRNVESDVCSVSESDSQKIVKRKECEDVRAVVNEISQIKEESRVKPVSDADKEESIQEAPVSPKKDSSQTKNTPEEMDSGSTDAVNVDFIPCKKESYSSAASVSPEKIAEAMSPVTEAMDECSMQDEGRSVDSNFEDKPRSPNSSSISDNDREKEVPVSGSCNEENMEIKTTKTLENNSMCQNNRESEERVPLTVESTVSQVLPVANVDSSNNVESFDSDISTREKSISQSGGSPDSAQDVMPESVINLQEKRAQRNEQECNSEATSSEQGSEETKSNKLAEDPPVASKGDNSSVVDSTSFPSNSEASPTSNDVSVPDVNFGDVADESKSSSPDSNCGSLNDEVSQSPGMNEAVVCSSNRSGNEASAESSSDSVADNNRVSERSECEQSPMEVAPEAELTSTSLRTKDCDDDDDDSCSSSNI